MQNRSPEQEEVIAKAIFAKAGEQEVVKLVTGIYEDVMEPSMTELTKKFVELATDDFVKNIEKHRQGLKINEVRERGDYRDTTELRETRKVGKTTNFREKNQRRENTHTGRKNVVP